MESLGEFLKHGREEAGLTLEELAQRTRIRIENLEALEREDLESLPTDIYVRGFVKLVCREVGLAPEEGLSRYEALRSTAGPADEIIWSEEREAPEPGWLERALRDPERVVRITTSAVKWGGLALGGVLILFMVVAGVKALRGDEEPEPAPAVRAEAPPPLEEAEPPPSETPPDREAKSDASPSVEPEKTEPPERSPRSAKARARDEPASPTVNLALVEPEIPERRPAGTIEAGDPEAAVARELVETIAADSVATDSVAAARTAAEEAAAAERAERERAAAERRAVTERAAAERAAAAEAAGELTSREQDRARTPRPTPPSPRVKSGDRLVLVVRAIRPVEVEVLLDGIGLPRGRRLAAGESKSWKADSLFLLSASDGGALRLTLDGVDLGIPGSDGEPLLHRAVRPGP